jgi:hypothetical protein
MTELCELAMKYGTDKGNVGNSHCYTSYYHNLFKNKRNYIRKILEIGIGNSDDMWEGYKAGASLFMWEEYFPNAEIYALDIVPETLINVGRIHSYLCNQGSLSSLKKASTILGGDFDLIIDDGSHVPKHQIQTLYEFFPLLNITGMYIIEDVWQVPEILNQIPYRFELKEFSSKADDKLIIIKKEDQ